MKVLLDTHVWLWMLSDSSRIPASTKTVLGEADLVVSAVSAWEIAIKHRLGKLALPEPPETFVPTRLVTTGTAAIPVTVEDGLVAGALPLHHRDPFDRMLIAQAQRLGVSLCSGDGAFDRYDVEVLWS